MGTRGWTNVTLSDIGMRAFPKQPQKRTTLPQERRSKYRAERTTVDGIEFASKAEARRYAELKLLERIGKIFRLQLQPRYRLVPFWPEWKDGEPPAIGEYVADFRYCNHAGCTCAWGCQVEDVKGFRTPLYRWKKKHVEAQYGIQIREVKT